MPPSAPTFAIRPNLTLFELRGKHAVRARRASRRARLVLRIDNGRSSPSSAGSSKA